jgi:hypothetical protein
MNTEFEIIKCLQDNPTSYIIYTYQYNLGMYTYELCGCICDYTTVRKLIEKKYIEDYAPDAYIRRNKYQLK